MTIAVLFCGLLVRASAADAPLPIAPPIPEAVDLEVFRSPLLKQAPETLYPTEQQRTGVDGWVVLTMMIDPKGKAYEVSVADSTGSVALEKAAVKAVSTYLFEPGTNDGQPIDSSTTLRINFELNGNQHGARGSFVPNKAIQVGDRAGADLHLRMEWVSLETKLRGADRFGDGVRDQAQMPEEVRIF
jgi:TonB family protein